MFKERGNVQRYSRREAWDSQSLVEPGKFSQQAKLERVDFYRLSEYFRGLCRQTTSSVLRVSHHPLIFRIGVRTDADRNGFSSSQA